MPVLIGAEIYLWFIDIQGQHESLGLLAGLNLLLATLPALAVAFLFARSFLVTAAPGVLLFGCGALIWSVSGLSPLAVFLGPGPSPNVNTYVTIHNITIWGASLCYLAGAALLQQQNRPPAYPARALVAAYALALAAAVTVFMAPQEWTPVFFIQGKGGTPERYFVLGSAIFTILLTLSLVRGSSRQRPSVFLHWFVPALLLVAIGCAGLMLQPSVGGVLNWVSRAAQFLGGAYMLAAAYAAFREPEVPFEVRTQSREDVPHRYSVAVALVLTAAVFRLVFLQLLETRAAFITFYPAVMLAAFYGGQRAGVLATILSAALVDYFWMPPFRSFVIVHPEDWLALALFVMIATSISWIVERLKQAQLRLHQAEAERRAELELMVGKRTAELNLAKDEAERARLRQEGLIQSAMDAIIAIDASQRIIIFNPAAEKMFGCPASEALGSPVDRFIPERFRRAHREHVKAFGATGVTSRQMRPLSSLRGLRQNGEEFPIEASISQLDVGSEKLFTAILRDITERERNEEHAELLTREVNHRAKNMLAVVQAIARQTAATEPGDFIARFDDRIKALSASQDLLVKNEWKGVDIAALVQSQLAHFKELIGSRIKLKGTALLISPSAAQTLSLALHELLTNAGKYGSLSNTDGRLEIAWSVERSEGREEAFEISWREEGGPPVTPPGRRGFGSTVIQRLASESLDAEVSLDFAAAGVHWRLRCPAQEVDCSTSPVT